MADDWRVLIANLGRLDDLLPCLESLFESVGDELSMRVIVGFNLRGDSDSPRKLRDVFPAVEQLRAPNKLGYCRAYNQLMARNTGRFVLLLDDDTIIRPVAIRGIIPKAPLVDSRG